MNYEELLKQISKSGPGYRWTITILLSVLSMKSAFDMFVTNLATASVPFHCAQAIVDNQTLSWTDVLAKKQLRVEF
uniref:Holin n=1 Tax=Macrostomum lignano TaxID=282301 RepID=A0A1I8I6B4_9PLAT